MVLILSLQRVGGNEYRAVVGRVDSIAVRLVAYNKQKKQDPKFGNVNHF